MVNYDSFKNQRKTLKLAVAISHHRKCSVRKGVLRNFAKPTGKHLCQSPYFNKVTGLTPATLLKKTPWHRCFPVNFAKFLRTPFLQNTPGRLLLSCQNVTISILHTSEKQILN